MGSDQAAMNSGVFPGTGGDESAGPDSTVAAFPMSAIFTAAGILAAADSAWNRSGGTAEAASRDLVLDFLKSADQRREHEIPGAAFGSAGAIRCTLTSLRAPDGAPAGASIVLDSALADSLDFLTEISHEMRTPLNAVMGFSEMLTSEIWGPAGDPRYKEYAADIHQSAHMMMDLINQLLEMAKADSGQLDLREEPLDLPALLGAVKHMLGPQAAKSGQTVTLNLPSAMPPLWGDLRMIRRIVMNLASNAVKFTPAGGKVSLCCGVDNAGRPFLAVEDTGIGITPEQAERAMRPFVQIDSDHARNAGPGTGLGLPIAQKFARLHGAELTLQSRPEGGARACVLFPNYRLSPKD